MNLYVPLDANYSEDAAIISVGPDAELCYVRALTLCKRLLTDGFIARAHLPRLAGDLHSIQTGEQTIEGLAGALVEHHLWTEAEGGWQVRGWLNWNPSRAEIDEGRRKASVGGVLGNHRRWHQDAPDPECPHCPSPRITPPDRPRSLTQREGKEKSTDARRIFDAWRESTGKARAVLDGKRERLIKARLKEFSVDDLVIAVGGWARSPFHSGENDRRRVYNDIELILRDAAHVEQFLDLARGGSGEWFEK